MNHTKTGQVEPKPCPKDHHIQCSVRKETRQNRPLLTLKKAGYLFPRGEAELAPRDFPFLSDDMVSEQTTLSFLKLTDLYIPQQSKNSYDILQLGRISDIN